MDPWPAQASSGMLCSTAQLRLQLRPVHLCLPGMFPRTFHEDVAGPFTLQVLLHARSVSILPGGRQLGLEHFRTFHV